VIRRRRGWVDGVAGAGEVRRRGSERGRGGGAGSGLGCHRGAAGVIMGVLVDPSASPAGAGAARSVPVGRSVGWAPPVAAIITRPWITIHTHWRRTNVPPYNKCHMAHAGLYK
jgi:hypothetical protein